MTIFFGALLLATLLGLAFEVLPKAVLALVVAGIALFAAVAFGVHFHHGPGHFIPAPVALIEWPTLGVIIGSSIFVEIASRSGIFTWSAIRLLKVSKGDPWRLLLLLGSLTLVFSAFLNNVTAMIIIGSLTVVACQRLEWDAKPFLLTEAFLTNVGGLLTMGGNGLVRISIQIAPWTVGTVSAINQTKDGGFTTFTKTGFVHGAASNNSSTATGSGVIQLISPQQITVDGLSSNASALSLFAVMTLHFIPEPGLLLMIGSGVVAMGLIGRSRMKK